MEQRLPKIGRLLKLCFNEIPIWCLLNISIITFLSCNQHGPNVVVKQDFIVEIQPFYKFPDSLTNYVCTQIKKISRNVQINTEISLPENAYNPDRTRYRADSLINFLKANQRKGNTVILGLTNKDISATKGTIKDWGIMGLGDCPGFVCVVSTFRLDKKNLLNQLFKISLHELGHTQGLKHCINKTCFMRDVEGGNPVNEEIGFCRSCKKILIDKGWLLN